MSDELHPAERARVIARANECSASFDKWHGWAVALNRGEGLILGVALARGLVDCLSSKPPWPVLAAGTSTYVLCAMLDRWCYRRAQRDLAEIKKAHDLVCGCDGSKHVLR